MVSSPTSAEAGEAEAEAVEVPPPSSDAEMEEDRSPSPLPNPEGGGGGGRRFKDTPDLGDSMKRRLRKEQVNNSAENPTILLCTLNNIFDIFGSAVVQRETLPRKKNI